MSYYENSAWSASGRQPSWEQPAPPSRSGSYMGAKQETIYRQRSETGLQALPLPQAATNPWLSAHNLKVRFRKPCSEHGASRASMRLGDAPQTRVYPVNDTMPSTADTNDRNRSRDGQSDEERKVVCWHVWTSRVHAIRRALRIWRWWYVSCAAIQRKRALIQLRNAPWSFLATPLRERIRWRPPKLCCFFWSPGLLPSAALSTTAE